jgi:hypothetical protein
MQPVVIFNRYEPFNCLKRESIPGLLKRLLFRALFMKLTGARNYRPSFRENKPKTLVFYY